MRTLLLFLPLIACQSTQVVCNRAAAFTASATLGTGDNAFEAFTEGDTLPAVWGPQNGQHIWGAIQVTGLNPGEGRRVNVNSQSDGGPTTRLSGKDPVLFGFTLTFPDERYEPYTVNNQEFFTGDVESAWTAGQTVFIEPYDIFEVYSEATSVEIEMAVSVEDVCGTVVSDARMFTLQAPTDEE